MEQSLGIPCCLSLATSTMVVVSLMTTTGSQIHRHQWSSLSMLFFFSGDFKGGTCHCWKVIFFYIWKWKMEKGRMALLLSWTLFNWWIHVALCTDRSLNQCTTTSVYSYLQLVPRKAYTSQWHMPFLKIAVLLGGNASWPSWRSTSLPKSLNLITSSLRVVPTGAPWEMNC